MSASMSPSASVRPTSMMRRIGAIAICASALAFSFGAFGAQSPREGDEALSKLLADAYRIELAFHNCDDVTLDRDELIRLDDAILAAEGKAVRHAMDASDLSRLYAAIAGDLAADAGRFCADMSDARARLNGLGGS